MFDWCCFPYPSEMWFFLYSSITLVFSFMLNKNCRTFQLLWQQNKFDGCFTICVSIYSLEHQSFHRGHSWLIYYTSQLNYWGQILQMQLNTKNYSCKQEWKSFRNDQWNMWKCDMNFVIYFKILNKCFILCIYLVVLLIMSAASEAVVVVIVW